MTTHAAHVRDVDDAGFERDVIQRSHQVPVVVDFWAAWCGPCRVLGPVLERLAGEFGGAFELAKVDVDNNPRVAQQFRVQSIPAVKAFRDGKQVDEFVGALPEARVRSWLLKIVPSEADRLAGEGKAAEDRGAAAAAERAYRAALELDASHAAAGIGLARILVAKGAGEEAEALLQRLATQPEAQQLRPRLRLRAAAANTDFGALQRRVEANPRDVEAHLQLGLALAGDEAYTSAMDHLLEAVRIDRRHADDGARKALLDLFTLLGEDDPRTQDYRRRLSGLLF